MLKEFEQYLLDRKKIAPRTGALYCHDIALFEAFLQSQGRHGLQESTIADNYTFLDSFKQSSKSASSMSRMKASLKAYADFKAGQLLTFAPSPYAYKLPFYCSESDARTILCECARDTSLHGTRVHLLVRTLLFTDIRLQQLITLTKDSVVLAPDKLVLVHGTKSYCYSLDDSFYQEVRLYLQSCNLYLFPVVFQETDQGRLSRAAAIALLRRLAPAVCQPPSFLQAAGQSGATGQGDPGPETGEKRARRFRDLYNQMHPRS